MGHEEGLDQTTGSADQRVKPKVDRTGTWVAAVIGGALAAGIIAAIAVHSGDSGPPDRSSAAVVACEGYVKDRLKAPSTAKFSDERYGVDGDLFTVTGSVDAQNSFGAMIRGRFTCQVRDLGGDSWPLLSLTGLT